jgi:16S rRNA G966 N2-methylase RsmD
VFLSEALDPKTKRVRDSFPCPNCSAELTKDNLQRFMETSTDSLTGEIWHRVRFTPVLINYSIGKTKHEKNPDEADLWLLNKIANLPIQPSIPIDAFPIKQMYHGSRLAPKGFTRVHHLFFPRAAQALGMLWAKATALEDARLRNMLLFFVEQAIRNLSLLNAYEPLAYSQNARGQKTVYYIPSQLAEVSPWFFLEGKLNRIVKAFGTYSSTNDSTYITTTSSTAPLGIPENSIDYIFTDPSFGENIYYADLSFLAESWHRIWTNSKLEVIVDQAKKKELSDYQRLMERCFEEYYRVLKPGRWMTMVFHNSRNAVWNAIQEAMLSAGFVVADIHTLDKQQGSYRQVTSTAVKQDLMVSAYKPNGGLEERFKLDAGTEEGVWDFVRAHLHQLPVFVPSKDGRAEVIAERMNYLLFDRMVAFHVQRHVTVPLSASEFYAGLTQRFPERDSMYFLPEQVVEYDKRRMTVKEILQIQLFVTDELSAIQWLRQ